MNHFERLTIVTRFTLESHSTYESYWNQKGEGNVAVEEAVNQITFHESGKWENGVFFSNIYRWTVKEGEIELAHLRQKESVFLYTMKEVSLGYYESTKPHLCGKDRYSGKLIFRENAIEFTWKVKGPQKEASSKYLYF